MVFSRDPYKPTRSWKSRALIGINILLATVLVSGLAVFGYARYNWDQVAKLSLHSLRGDDGIKNPMNVLVVGSDSREELAPGQAKSFGSGALVAGQRSDTIMIMHVDPKQNRAAVLSIPRDTFVTIADTNGHKDRINSAFEAGPDRLIKTIQENFDIPIDHYVQVDFDGFRGIVSSIGGVQVRFDAPARDKMSGLAVSNAGCVMLSGDQALAYVRSRHYESYERGRWVQDPRSDLSRIDRQQDFIRRVLRKAVHDGARNPIKLNSLITTGVKNVKVDNGFSFSDIARLGRRFQSLDPNAVEMMTIPTTPKVIGGADVLLAKEPDAGETVDRFLNGPKKADETPNIPPSSISVRVLNGSSVPGLASTAGGDLKDAGFVVAGTGNYKSGSANTKSIIRYGQNQKDKADVLKAYIDGDVDLVQDNSVSGADLMFVTGSSFKGIKAPGAPTSVPPSTQKPQASTTVPDDQTC